MAKKELKMRVVVAPTETVIVSAYDKDGKADACTLAFYMVSSHVPPCVTIGSWGTDRNVYFVVESHPGLTDLFVTQARKEYARIQEKTENRESVLAKLQKPLAKASAKPGIKTKEPEL